MLPRIPFAKDFRAFADAGTQLAALHLGYETVEPYPLEGLDVSGPGGEADYGFFAVGDKKMVFGKPTAEQKAAGLRHDRSVIRYSDRITPRGVPEEAYRYTLGSRSAIEWIIDRYWVRTDKASGIVNDPNNWSREVGDPRYILDLLAGIVTVSLETIKVVDSLPRLMSATTGERHGTARPRSRVRRPLPMEAQAGHETRLGGPCPAPLVGWRGPAVARSCMTSRSFTAGACLIRALSSGQSRWSAVSRGQTG